MSGGKLGNQELQRFLANHVTGLFVVAPRATGQHSCSVVINTVGQ